MPNVYLQSLKMKTNNMLFYVTANIFSQSHLPLLSSSVNHIEEKVCYRPFHYAKSKFLEEMVQSWR